MKMSLRLMTCFLSEVANMATVATYVLVPQMLQELQFSVCSL